MRLSFVLPVALVRANAFASATFVATGADLDIRDANGRTALGQAIEYRNARVAELLRSHGAKE